MKNVLLLINTGSPKSPAPDDVAEYLEEFLTDPRIVPLPGFVWKLILNRLILPKRKFLSAKRYEQIWTKEGSPLVAHTKELAKRLQERLGAAWHVCYAMRYGAPCIDEILREIKKDDYAQIYVMPMYPQQASQTTGSVWDSVDRAAHDLDMADKIRRIGPWYAQEGYIHCLAQNLRQFMKDKKAHLVVSFHGLPKKGAETYEAQVRETTRLLTEALNLSDAEYSLCFQSKFGRGRWLSPTTEETLVHLAQKGVRSVIVVCPGFSVDCLETLEEVAVGLREVYLSHGGVSFTYVPALNSEQKAAEFYCDYVLRQKE